MCKQLSCLLGFFEVVGFFSPNLLYVDIKLLNSEMGVIYFGGQRRHFMTQT